MNNKDDIKNPGAPSKSGADALKLAAERLYYWQECGATNFTAGLYDLFCRADVPNRERLYLAFPIEGLAFAMWESSKDPKEFYAMFGLDEKEVEKEKVP